MANPIEKATPIEVAIEKEATTNSKPTPVIPIRKTEDKEKLQAIDLKELTLENIDTMSHEALKNAIQSVVRHKTSHAMHRDHRSHSSSETMT